MAADDSADADPGRTTAALSDYVTTVDFDDIPEAVAERERWHVLDTLGCILYGTTTPWVDKVVRTLDDLGETGTGGAPVLGTDLALPPARAVLVNGTASHSMDFDDYCQDAGVHAGSAVVPCALAHCATAEGTVSGAEFLTAVTAGVETGIRTGYAIGRDSLARGWHIAGWTGAFAGAATAARLADLDADAASHALAIAGTQGAGLMGATYGAEVKRFHMGKAAESGYLAAGLAGNEFTGDTGIFGDRWGSIGPTMSDEYDTAAAVEGLGETYELAEKLTFKPFPSVGQTHPPVTAVRELVEEHGLDTDDVQHVRVRVTAAAKDKSGWEYEPLGVMSAQGNMAYAVATFLLDGAVTIDAYTEEAIRRPDVLDRVGDVEVVADDSLAGGGGFNERYHTVVEVETADGGRYERAVRIPKGFPENPMSDDELLAKFRDQAGRVLPDDDVEAVIDFVLAIDERDDVSELFDYL